MNGWQRLWVVISLAWFGVCSVVFFASGGLPAVYEPPQVEGWSITCDLETVVKRLIDDGEKEDDIAPVIKGAKDEHVEIRFWIPKGMDGKRLGYLSCANAQLAYNPETKQKTLAVFATLDNPRYATFQAGYDIDDVLGTEMNVRIERSKVSRRNAELAWMVGMLSPPLLLYVIGFAIAWVRRGFRQGRTTTPSSQH